MKKSLITMAALTPLLLTLGACAWLSPGEAKSEANAVSRRYNRPSTEVWSALTESLQALELRIEADHHDALGGELQAKRATSDTVKIVVKSVDENSAQVSVTIGDGDRNLADIIHAQLARNLGTGAAKSSFYGGNRWERTYDATLAQCIVAGERACEAVGFSVGNRDIRDASADLLARRAPSSTILLHFENAAPPSGEPSADGKFPSDSKGRVKVSFIVGTMRSDDNEEIVQKLKSEFERHVGK